MFLKNYKNKFIRHNKKIFSIEFDKWQSVQIANSYIVNTFLGIEDTKVAAYESTLYLPIYYKLPPKDQNFVIKKIKEFFEHLTKKNL